MPYTYAGRYSDRWQNRFGNAHANLPITVYEDEEGTTLATLYSDRAQTTPMVNPTATDGEGNLTFYAEPGEYWLVPTFMGVDQAPVRTLVPVDPEDAVGLPIGAGDVEGTLPTGGTTGQALVKNSGDDYDTIWSDVGEGGSGVSDHGALTGLSDDDHSIYALADGSRGTFEASGAVATHAADTTDVHGIADTADLTTTAEATALADAAIATHEADTTAHGLDTLTTDVSENTTAISDINTTLSTDYETAAESAARVTTHEAAADPHNSAGYVLLRVLSSAVPAGVITGGGTINVRLSGGDVPTGVAGDVYLDASGA